MNLIIFLLEKEDINLLKLRSPLIVQSECMAGE